MLTCNCRFAAGAAPRVAKRVLGPAAAWLAKRSSRLLPLLARRIGRAAPKITRCACRIKQHCRMNCFEQGCHLNCTTAQLFAASWVPKRLVPQLDIQGGCANMMALSLHQQCVRDICCCAGCLHRIGGRLAGRMAPRYVKDKFTGHTMQMAFHDADTGMTQTVAK